MAAVQGEWMADRRKKGGSPIPLAGYRIGLNFTGCGRVEQPAALPNPKTSP